MRRNVLLATIAAVAALVIYVGWVSSPLEAQAGVPAARSLRGGVEAGVALTGLVTSGQEGPMEGVVVSARKDGSTISIAVVTDANGRYQFPVARLEPGRYVLKIRAIG
jgi:Carboxypeptidase regulatory-like domain